MIFQHPFQPKIFSVSMTLDCPHVFVPITKDRYHFSIKVAEFKTLWDCCTAIKNI